MQGYMKLWVPDSLVVFFYHFGIYIYIHILNYIFHICIYPYITARIKVSGHYSLGISTFNRSVHQLQDVFVTARLLVITHSTQISLKQDESNIYTVMKTIRPPGYHHNSFVTTHGHGRMMYGFPTTFA